MNKKCLPFILASFVLCGCVQAPSVSEENALEVAVDDSNVDMAEVTSSEVKKSDGVYKVVFTTESGKYTYTVGTDGLIQDRDYKAGETEEVQTEQPEQKKEEPKQEENTDEKKTQAENSALSNVGLSRDQVSSITSELSADQTQYTVVIVAGDSRTTCIVNANTGEVISTMFE